MPKPMTHVLLVTDMSGSMIGLADDVRGGFKCLRRRTRQGQQQVPDYRGRLRHRVRADLHEREARRRAETRRRQLPAPVPIGVEPTKGWRRLYVATDDNGNAREAL